MNWHVLFLRKLCFFMICSNYASIFAWIKRVKIFSTFCLCYGNFSHQNFVYALFHSQRHPLLWQQYLHHWFYLINLHHPPMLVHSGIYYLSYAPLHTQMYIQFPSLVALIHTQRLHQLCQHFVRCGSPF